MLQNLSSLLLLDIRKSAYAIAMMVALASGTVLSSCSDRVDESDMYSFKSDLITSYVAKKSDLSYFYALMQRTRLGKSASTVDQLLAARGNYTCFLPTNEAIAQYVDSITGEDHFSLDAVPDSLAKLIVCNSIIDNGTQDAYLSTTFATGALEKPNFNDRFLTVSFDTVTGGRAVIYINTFSQVLDRDIKVENGVIHIVNRVISPSSSSLPDLIDTQDNLRIFSHLLKATGWDRQMRGYRNDDYENANHLATMVGLSGSGTATVPTHDNIGYTAFVETDSLLEKAWGITLEEKAGVVTNWDAVMDRVKTICQQYYPDATGSNMTSEDNAVNQFVSYHLINGAVPFGKLVIHYNEVGYAYTNPTVLGIDKMQYFETLGTPRRLLKLTEGSQTEGKRINRYVSERDDNTYREVTVPIAGTLVSAENGRHDNAALNGYYYPIDQVLVYTDQVKNQVLNERLRFDVMSLQPELMTNGLRNLMVDKQYYIPKGYCKNMTFSDETICILLTAWGEEGWLAYEEDEPTFEGQYDITFRMPPVPFSGTYEIRLCYAKSDARGMCQTYYGTNAQNLQPIGLPVDMRLRATSAAIGWIIDGDDEDANRENDKTMRIHGYMKCPACFGYPNRTGSTPGRNLESGVKLRQIIYRGPIDKDKTYYMRFKSVLENIHAQFDFDFIELVPKNVYDGPTPEDIW